LKQINTAAPESAAVELSPDINVRPSGLHQAVNRDDAAGYPPRLIFSGKFS
jgi:hypothetical protein